MMPAKGGYIASADSCIAEHGGKKTKELVTSRFRGSSPVVHMGMVRLPQTTGGMGSYEPFFFL